jgi:hypothetical protein
MSYKEFIHCLSCVKEGCLNLDEESAEDFWHVLRELEEHDNLSTALDKAEGLS